LRGWRLDEDGKCADGRSVWGRHVACLRRGHSPEDADWLASTRFDAGYPDAASHLEEAYLALGYDSPMRASLEEALGALGLF
jgi:hypothetical protein